MDKITIEVSDLSQVSDGYHTLAELYDHRITLYIALCKAKQRWIHEGDQRNLRDNGYDKLVWRSKKHGDGKPAYKGWFILGIGRKKGEQITYHIPLGRWDETDFAQDLKQAPKWDKHTSADVLYRLKAL
jgi:hypothetical protein